MSKYIYNGNNIESYNLGICCLVISYVVTAWVLSTGSTLLYLSHSGKAERRSKWNNKKQNERRAKERKAIAAKNAQKLKAENKKCKANKLNSQSGTETTKSGPKTLKSGASTTKSESDWPWTRLLRLMLIFLSFGVFGFGANRWSFSIIHEWLTNDGFDLLNICWTWCRTPKKFTDPKFSIEKFFSESWTEIKKIFTDFNISLPDLKAIIPDLDFSDLTWAHIKRAKIVTDLYEICCAIVTIGWMEKFEFELGGCMIFKCTSLRREISGLELLEMLYSYCAHVWSCSWSAITGTGLKAFWMDAINSDYEVNWTYLLTTEPLIECGRLELEDGTKIDPHEYDRLLEEMIVKTTKILDTCKHGEKSYYAPKLLHLKSLRTKRVLSQKRGIRAAPLGVLIHGESSVGKSVMTDVLVKYVLEVNGFDASEETIISLNEFDRFQSEYRTHHNAVIFDDLANGKAEHAEGNPLMKVVQFINNNPCAALNPNLELKGNIMIEPKLVFATTNVKRLMAETYSNEPLAINRRFPLTITQSVRPEFQKEDSHMLDGSKLSRDAVIDDFALFTVEYPKPKACVVGSSVEYVPYELEGEKMIDIGIKKLLKLLMIESRKHFAEQEQLLAKKRLLAETKLCEHDNFPELCDECHAHEDVSTEPLDSQVGALPNFAEAKDWLLALEERICLYLEARLLAFLKTEMGCVLLLALYKDTLRSILLRNIQTVCAFTIILIFYDETLRASLTMLVAYVCYCLYESRSSYNAALRRYSTVPRPSRWIRNMSSLQKTGLIAMFGGLAFFRILFLLIQKWRKLPVAQAAAPIVLTDEGAPTLHPSWGDSGHPEREAANNIACPVQAMTTSRSQLVGTIGKKLCYLSIDLGDGTSTFCNALPVTTGVFVIPAHIVKDKQLSCTLHRSAGNMVRCNLSKFNTKKLIGDLSLWYVPEAGPQRDLTTLFPEHTNAYRHVDAEMVYNDHGKIVNYGKMNCIPGRVYTTEGGTFKGLNYIFPGQTFEGLCLAVLVGQAPYAHIAGFHLAGRDSKGAAGVVTREVLLKGIDEVTNMSVAFKSHSAAPLETKVCGIPFGPLRAPHEKSSVHTALPDAKMQVYGDHTMPIATQRSNVRKTMISDDVAEVMDIERSHGRPYKMEDSMHWEVDIAAKTATAYDFEDQFVAAAFEDYSKHIHDNISDKDLEKVGKLPLDAVLAGIDGVSAVNAMNFATSSGFGIKGKKNVYVEKSERHVDGISCPRDVDPMIMEEVEKLRAKLAAGESINTIFKGSLKDEPTKLTKKKVRVFAACNLPFTILVREYFLTLSKLMQDNPETFECAVGIVAESPQWTDFMNFIYKNGKDRCVAGDYAAFDGRMSPKFMALAFKVLVELAERSGNYDEEDLTIMRGIATEITNPLYDHHGTLVRFFGSNPSGHPLTVVINSIVNSLYMRYCYFKLSVGAFMFPHRVPPFAQVVALMTYGDDNIMTVAKGYDYFNHTSIAKVLADAGITYTMADKEAESVPFIHASETSFLKRSSVWDKELNLYRAPIELGSISKSLHAQVESDVLTREQHSAEAIRGAAEKFFEFGREEYTIRVSQLEEVAKRAGLMGYIGDLKTYDERLSDFRKKFDWQ